MTISEFISPSNDQRPLAFVDENVTKSHRAVVSVNSFCEYENLPFAVSSHFSPFWPKQPFDFSDVLHKQTMVYLCLILMQWMLVSVALKK